MIEWINLSSLSIGIDLMLKNSVGAGTPITPPGDEFLLLESGDKILLESGDGILLE